MSTRFDSISPEALSDNTFKLIGTDWMLLTAGTPASYNMMTASWGGFGVLWHKNVCFCVLRPQRYTLEFVEKNEYFSLCFFDETYRDILSVCGSKSGREINKMKDIKLSVTENPEGGIYFKEARIILICKKLYFQDILPGNFIDPEIEINYPKKDYHRMYIGEITNCLRVRM